MSNLLRLACAQIHVSADKQANIATACSQVAAAAAAGAHMLALPECWNSPYAVTAFPDYAEHIPAVGTALAASSAYDDTCPSLAAVARAAAEHRMWVVAGSIPERSGDGSLYNTAAVLSSDGTLIAAHRKMHLFDIDIPGAITFKESDSLQPGSAVTTFDTPWGTAGLAICFDMRFPELAAAMVQAGARLLFYPGAFNTTTGPMHWELLARARAVDSQCWLAAVSPAQDCEAGYVAYGHTILVDPWGQVVEQAGTDAALLVQEVDMDEVARVRERIPLAAPRQAAAARLAAGRPDRA